MDPVIGVTVRGATTTTDAELMSVATDSQGDVVLEVNSVEWTVDRADLLTALGAVEYVPYEEAA